VVERRRPLLGAPGVEGLHARGDHPAVHQSGHDRRGLPAGDPDHHLVEHRDALGDPAHRDQGLSLPEPGEGDQVPVGEPLADLALLGERRVRLLGLPGHQRLQRVWERQVTPGDAVPLSVVDRATRPPDPAAGPGPLTTVHQPVDEPEPVESGALGVAPLQPLAEGTLEQGDVVFVTPGEVRRAAGSFEILRLQPRLPVGRAQPFVGRAPGMPFEGLATLPERRSCGHAYVPRRHLALYAAFRAVQRARSDF
jgi:hypothetical protein